jgi:hypothetical protein
MSPPTSYQSNIPHNRPPQTISSSRRFLILSLVFFPVMGYTVLRIQENKRIRDVKRVEEEGRENWRREEKEKNTLSEMGKDLGVGVERSGGGV